MADASFLYIAFFLTIGSFVLGFVASWNLKHVFDVWVDRADYAKVVMHPEMYEDGELTNEPLIYLHIDDEDDMMFDEDD
tara:strand:+ start:7004 stop:7240 length:237 start_codon:yes stop_codon:yes gene_type:complete